jgi:hypothetical protein
MVISTRQGRPPVGDLEHVAEGVGDHAAPITVRRFAGLLDADRT